MTFLISARSSLLRNTVITLPGLAWLILQASAASAIVLPASDPGQQGVQPIELAQGVNGGPSLLPDLRPNLPDTGSGNDWPGPGMRQQGLPSVQDYNRTVNYWIRRTGPMGVDRCALSDLHRTNCD